MSQVILTTRTGGRVDVRVDRGGRYSWHCHSCGHVGYGTAAAARRDGTKHLETRTMCAIRPRTSRH